MSLKNICVFIALIMLTLAACDNPAGQSEKPAGEHGHDHSHEQSGEDTHDHDHEHEGDGEKHAHAPKGYVPGSHEDWCGEHAVPESMCTRCNPSLIPAFKAQKDWCDEHKLPKSQCLACNPDLEIKRPPKKEAK